MAPSVTASPTAVKMNYNTSNNTVGGSPSRGSTNSNMASPNNTTQASGTAVGAGQASGSGSGSEHVMEKRVEELFETQSVSELKSVERKFHSDIERKRQDLRLLVGERYKDVIDVSDKLTGITTHSAQVKKRLERMQTLCDDLRRNQQRQRQLSTGQSRGTGGATGGISGSGLSSSVSSNTQSLQLACQLRLLSLMPENVLLFLDKCEYVKAAHLVEFSNSLRSSLLGPLNENADLIKSKFPIVNRISTTHFKSTVRQSLQSHLIKMTQSLVHDESKILEQGTEIILCSTDDAKLFCEIIEAFSILDNCSLLEAILQTLEIFSDHITHILTDVESTQSVSDILTIASKLYYFAVYCTALAFDSLTRRNEAGPVSITFDELYPSQVQLKNFLPANVTATAFVRKSLVSENEGETGDVNATKKSVIAAIEDQLMNKVRRHVEEQLGYVKSVKSLTNIKTKLLQIEDGIGVTATEAVKKHVSLLTDDVTMKEFTYWEQLFEPLFTSCAKKLLKKSVLEQWNSEAKILLEERIVPLIDTVNVSYKLSPNGPALNEVDMPTHVWNEELNFVVHSSEQQSKDAAKTSEPDSLWKLSGRSAAQAETPAVVSVCRKIDEIVEALCESGSEFFRTASVSLHSGVFNDTSGGLSPAAVYGSGRSVNSSEKESGEKSKTAMEEMNQQITVILLQKLVNFFADMNSADQSENETKGDISSYEVQLRLFSYLLCNANCLRHFERNEMTSECFVQLEKLMGSLHRKWLDKLCKEVLSCLNKSVISTPLSQEQEGTADQHIKQQHAQLLAACWEQVDIEEESEDGTPIVTKLPIPIKASYAVHDMLFILTNALNRVTPLVTSEYIHRQQRAYTNSANTSRTGAQSKTALENNYNAKPFLIATEINENLCRDVRQILNDKLVQFYEDTLYNEVSSEVKNTKLMIQIIYDIKLLSALLSNANESYSSGSGMGLNYANNKMLSSVVSRYEQHVDPFDYDVYTQHLSDKLSLEINQSQHLYGFLLAPSGGVASKALSLSGAALQGSSSGKATTYHNLCQLVQNPIKFQPLSVPHSAASFGLKRTNASSSLLQGGSGNGNTGAVGVSGQSVAAAGTPEKLQTGASLLKGWLKG